MTTATDQAKGNFGELKFIVGSTIEELKNARIALSYNDPERWNRIADTLLERSIENLEKSIK